MRPAAPPTSAVAAEVPLTWSYDPAAQSTSQREGGKRGSGGPSSEVQRFLAL
jgi:hypothetical protein